MIRGPPDCQSRNMITACCDHEHLVGRPQAMGKNFIVENLHLLFQDIPTIQIDQHGSLRSWIYEVSNEKYWCQHVDRLLHPATPIPEQPADWGPLPSWQACCATNGPPPKMVTLPTAMMRQPQTTGKNSQGHHHTPRHRNNPMPQRSITTQNDGSMILLSAPWSDEVCPTPSRFSV
jgi:hypothetical protein